VSSYIRVNTVVTVRESKIRDCNLITVTSYLIEVDLTSNLKSNLKMHAFFNTLVSYEEYW